MPVFRMNSAKQIEVKSTNTSMEAIHKKEDSILETEPLPQTYRYSISSDEDQPPINEFMERQLLVKDFELSRIGTRAPSYSLTDGNQEDLDFIEADEERKE